MVFLLRTVLMVALLTVVSCTGALLLDRPPPGPSLLAYTSQRPTTGFDLYVTWPGRRVPQVLSREPTDETQPAWAPVCAQVHARPVCSLAYLTTTYETNGRVTRSLFTVQQDGSARVSMSQAGRVGLQFSWSPDGRALAIELREDVRSDIYVVRAADGALIANVSDHTARDMMPLWSPDGAHIAFISFRGSEAANQGKIIIAEITPDFQVTRLATITQAPTDDTLADWSPDGAWLLYTASQPYGPPYQAADIYMVRSDGSDLRRLTDDPAPDMEPVWSPDGQWIAFESERDGNTDIFLMRADGSAPRNLTHSPSRDINPIWTPDGQFVIARQILDTAYSLVRLSPFAATAPADTPSPAAPLFATPDLDWGPVWSADGRWVAFESMRDGNREVYAARVDGSAVVNVSRYDGVDSSPAWSPPLAYPYRPLPLFALAILIGGAWWGLRRYEQRRARSHVTVSARKFTSRQ